MKIYVDADGCPVKNEIYKVASRYKLKVFVVANRSLNIPLEENIEMIVVSGNFDATDDWIIDHINTSDVVITADILLADRVLKKNGRALGPKGKEFTADSIGSAIATRELMANLRHMGEATGGPSSMQPKDRSQFLSQLDQVIQSVIKNRKSS